MNVKPGGAIAIDAMGANGHFCDLKGKLTGPRVTTPEGCVFSLLPKGGGMAVVIDEKNVEACRVHCGMRASFDGDYFAQPPACRDSAVKSTRAQFLKLYKAGQAAEGAVVLDGLLQSCGRFFFWTEDGAVRNDLALARSRAGDNAACLRVLEPLKRTFVNEPGDITFGPSEVDTADRLRKTTRFNWKLCGGK